MCYIDYRYKPVVRITVCGRVRAPFHSEHQSHTPARIWCILLPCDYKNQFRFVCFRLSFSYSCFDLVRTIQFSSVQSIYHHGR